jgi:hypothetical protein
MMETASGYLLNRTLPAQLLENKAMREPPV